MLFGDGSLEEVLQDEEDVDMDELQEISVCAGCLSDSSSPHPVKSNAKLGFIRKAKCEICHVVHLVEYGETSWAASLRAIMIPPKIMIRLDPS